MATPSSSTKKAAKLAKSGQGRTVRFQGGTLFPLVVAIVIVLGLGLIVYSRQSRPAADASAPTVNDHWHHSYGFYLCDTWFMLTGTLEDQSSPGFDAFARTGIHSHDDGLMHWHPATSASVGQRATLGLFLDNYGVELTNNELSFPPEQVASPEFPTWNEDGVFEEGETTCTIDGAEEDAELKVIVWNNYTDTDDGTTYIADFDSIKLNQDQMVVSIAFVPEGTDVGMPPWSSDLPTLGAADGGQVFPEESGTDGTGSVPETGPADSVPAAPATTGG